MCCMNNARSSQLLFCGRVTAEQTNATSSLRWESGAEKSEWGRLEGSRWVWKETEFNVNIEWLEGRGAAEVGIWSEDCSTRSRRGEAEAAVTVRENYFPAQVLLRVGLLHCIALFSWHDQVQWGQIHASFFQRCLHRCCVGRNHLATNYWVSICQTCLKGWFTRL